jgi:hypothetical protein
MILTEEKLKYWEKNVFQCQFVYNKTDIDWPGIEGMPPL